MGGRGGSFSGGRRSSRNTSAGANFKTVQDVQTALTREHIFSGYACLVKYDYNDPNDIYGTPVVDVKTANAIYDMMHKIVNEFPELKGIAYCLSPEDMPDNVYAHCHMHSGEINFNSKKFDSWDAISAMNASDISTGWSPQGTENPASIIAHEFGHAIDGWLSIKKGLFGFTKSGNIKYASSEMRPKVMRAAGLKVSDISTAVSRYAATDAMEWFAESFAEYISSPNPRPAAAAFGKVLKHVIKQAASK